MSARGEGEGLWGEALEGRELELSPPGVGGAGEGSGLSPGGVVGAGVGSKHGGGVTGTEPLEG